MKKVIALCLSIITVFALLGGFTALNKTEALAATDTTLGATGSAEESPDGSEADTTNPIEATNLIAYYKGKVIYVETITSEQDPEMQDYEIKQISQVEILTGKFAGRVYTLNTNYNLDDPKQIILETGTTVMLSAMLNNSGDEISSMSIFDYYRTDHFLWMFLITVGIVLLVCLFKGIKAMAGIVLMALGLYFYFVPLMLKGYNPVMLMMPLCIIVGSITIILDVGFSPRCLSAILGMASGTMFAGIAGLIIENSAHLVGLGETELRMFLYMNEHTPVSFSGMSFALCMLISLGGVVDTCTGLTEEMHLMKTGNPYITKMSLMRYGLNQGRYNMSRNINTIFFTVLALILPAWIIYVAYNTPLIEMFNMDYIASLFLRALAAIIGIVLSMPVTAFVYATQLKKDSMYS